MVAQDDFEKKLRKYFETFKSSPTINEQSRQLKITGISQIVKQTKDSILKKEANAYLIELNEEKIVNPEALKLDVSKIPSEKLKNFNYNQDKFTGSTFFTHKKSGNRIKLYIGCNKENVYLRFVCVYEGSEWVFIKSIVFLIDGEKFEFIPSNSSRDVINSSVGVRVKERIDEAVNENDLKLMNAIANTKNDIDVRFEGEKIRDDKFLKKIAIHFKETLELYDYLKNEFKL